MCVRLILRHRSCSLGEFLKASIHPPLVVYSVLQLHLSAELLLGTPDVRHLGEDEVEDLHDFIPMLVILVRSLCHSVQHKLGLPRGSWRRHGGSTACRSKQERNYGQQFRRRLEEEDPMTGGRSREACKCIWPPKWVLMIMTCTINELIRLLSYEQDKENH